METKSLKLSRRISVIVMGCVLLLITPGLSVSAQPTKQESGTQEQDIQFGGTYANLKPEQRRLVDEWFRQFNEVTKQNSIFGIRLKESDLKDDEARGGRIGIPRFPRAGRGKPQEAVYDFLNSWLVEQQPNQAVAYISPRAFTCIEQVASDEQKKKINPGLVPYYILEEMKKINRTLGRPGKLSDVAESVRPNEPALRPIRNPHHAEFDLFETPDDIAFDFECANRNRLEGETEKGKPERRYGKYVGASLRLKSPQAMGDRLLILWAKESGYWKVISWSIEPDQLASKKAPEAAQAAVAETKLERVAGDPAMIAAAAGFFDAWFVKQNFDQAVEYVSERSYPCINLYLDESVKKVRNWSEGRQKLREGMRSVAKKIGRKNDVSEAVGASFRHILI
jgi:hypothetical protein